jgi:hypothetical protein
MDKLKAAVAWGEAHPWEMGAIVLVGALVLLWLFGAFSKSSSGSATDSSGASTSNVAAYYGAEAASTQAGAAVQIATLQTAASTNQNQSNNDAAVAIDAADNKTSQLNTSTYYNSHTTETLGQQATDVATAGIASRTALGTAAISSRTQLGVATIQGQTQTTLGLQNMQSTIAQSNNAAAASIANTNGAVKTAQIQATSAAYHDYLSTAMPAEIAVGQTTAGLATFNLTPSGGYSVTVPPIPAASKVNRPAPALALPKLPALVTALPARIKAAFQGPPERAGASASGGGGNR